MAFDISRRRVLRGAMGLTVGLPLLDAMLDVNGTALAATGTTVPVRFGTWFWGLGVNPSRWFPDKAGANYELKPELAPIKALQGKINILGNFNVPLDGAPNLPHISGGAAVRTGRALTADRGLPGESFDVKIGDQIGARNRFRSLEASAIDDARNSLSGRGGGNLNPSETTASGLYARLFGLGFCDQTRVFNMLFNNGASNLTRIGSTITHHQLTHEEVLDNTVVFAHSETEFAKFHTIDNLPIMTAGSAGGKVRTGVYVDGGGCPISRVGQTLQQVMGVSVDKWGTGSMCTSKTVSEIVA